MIAEKIVSKENEKIKLLKKLAQKKYREQTGKFIVENFVTIYDAVLAGFDFESLFITDEFLQKNNEKLEQIFQKTKIKNYFLIDEIINQQFSELENPSGICAVFKQKESQIDFAKTIVYLNSVKDPGNLGTIIRSAVAFGLENIVLDEHCADLYNPKTISAVKNAIFEINISFDKNLEVLKKINRELKIFSTSLDGDRGLEVLKKEKNFCIVFGDEAHGVSQEITQLSDDLIKINISPKIESLNVAITAGIVFYTTQLVP
jgi:TrmH family RNA methyltransferase